MTKKAGERLKIGEVKTAIISYILENNDSVREPDIRNYLLEKFGIKNQGTINDHLHELSGMDCISSVTPNRKSRSNFWDIKTLRNLKNIRREFPNVHINSKEKSIIILFEERGYSLDRIGDLFLYVELISSVSLFDALLDNNITELQLLTEKIYSRTTGYTKSKDLDECIEKFNEMYFKATPNFQQNSNVQHKKMHVESFIPTSKEDFLITVKKHYPQLTTEMIPIVEKIHYLLNDFYTDFNKNSTTILLEHFINHDTFRGIESPDEYGFFTDLKESREKAVAKWNEEGNIENTNRLNELIRLQELEVCSKIIKKYKHPSTFYIPENPDAIYESLLYFYKDQIK
jgi:hypothetical protein